MKPSRFDLFRPATLEEALELLSRYGDDAVVIAGGQSLVPMMNLRMARPAVLVDLAGVAGLSGISRHESGLRIGAMTRQSELLTNPEVQHNLPLLARAAGFIGHLQTRARGTVGGSLANADPSAEISVVAVTLGATLKLQSLRGERQVSASDFFVDALTTTLEEDEILTEVDFPAHATETFFAFHEVARRHGDFAIASCAVYRCPAERHLRIGLGGVGTVPVICNELGEAVSVNGFDPDAVSDIVSREIGGIEPMDDLNASAQYRRHLAVSLLDKCIREVLDDA